MVVGSWAAVPNVQDVAIRSPATYFWAFAVFIESSAAYGLGLNRKATPSCEATLDRRIALVQWGVREIPGGGNAPPHGIRIAASEGPIRYRYPNPNRPPPIGQ